MRAAALVEGRVDHSGFLGQCELQGSALTATN